MHAHQYLRRAGGVANRQLLVEALGRPAFEAAVRTGEIERTARGSYALPTLSRGLKAAQALNGIASLHTAAAYHGWATKLPPERPCVTVPTKRRIAARRREGIRLLWADLRSDDVDGLATSRARTLSDCMRLLPFDEALAIADSALRLGDGVTKPRLEALSAAVRGKGAAQARRVAALADRRAANPFESVLRAIAYDVPRLRLEPQLSVVIDGTTLHPDLGDPRHRILAEADSFEWHGDRAALKRDARRYNAFAADGWLVLRFSWEDVMHDPSMVADTLRRAALTRA